MQTAQPNLVMNVTSFTVNSKKTSESCSYPVFTIFGWTKERKHE